MGETTHKEVRLKWHSQISPGLAWYSFITLQILNSFIPVYIPSVRTQTVCLVPMCATGFSGILLIKCKNKTPWSCLCDTVTTPTKSPRTSYKNPTDIKCASDQPLFAFQAAVKPVNERWYLKCSRHAARESLMHNGGRCSPPPFWALRPRQCFGTTLRFRRRGRSCGCSSGTARQSKRSRYASVHWRSSSVMFYWK